MAEETKQLIFSLEFDTDEGLKRAAEYRYALDADRESLAALNKEIKASGPVTKEQLVQREQLEKRIRDTSKARADELKAVDSYIKATKNATDENGNYNGSIKQMRSSLAFLTEKWNDLSKEERENIEVGGNLQKEIKRLSDELKGLEGSVGDTRRNVGNYAGGLREAINESGFLSGVTMQVKDAQEKLVSTLNIVKAGIGGNISVLKLFRLALAATGIGAVLLVLGGLISYLTKTQEGIDFVNRKTKAFTTVLAVLTDKLSGVGKAVFEAFSNPKQALIDLVNFIQQNLLNRVKSIAVIFDALKNRDFTKLQDGITQLATGITDASGKAKRLVVELSAVAKTAEAIELANQKIRDAERALNVERAQSKAQIEALKFIAEDVTRSDSERIAAARKAFAIEQDIVNRQLELQRKRIANIVKEQSLTNNLTEDNDKLAEERMKLAEMEEASSTRQIELRNKINEINAAAAAKREAEFNAHKERLKSEIQDLMDGLKNIQEIYKKRLDAEKKFREDSQKLIDQQFQNSEKAREKEDKERLAQLQFEKDLAQQRMDIKEAEYNAAQQLAQAGAEVFAVLADENSAFVTFQKVLTGLQIAIDQAKAISKLTASATEVAAAVAVASGPLGPVTGPLAYAAYYGTQIATIISGFAQAKQLLTGDVPQYKAAEGGLLVGPSHAAGGIRGTGAFGNVEVEGGEAIINKRSTSLFAPILSAINQLGGGRPLMPTNFAAAGGVVPSYLSQNMPPVIDYNALAKAMASHPVYVIPTEIRDKANAADARKVKAGIGYR